jgi:DNA-binding LytR/AlgR family response regulator
MKFNCLIVEDEPLGQEVLEIYIKTLDYLTLINKCFNVHEAREIVSSGKVDILFLDIHMPHIDGITFLRSSPVKPITILTTAFRDYAIEAYDLGVIDYLVKPIEYDRFAEAVLRATEFLRLKDFAASVINTKSSKLLKVKSSHQYITINTDSISHIQGLKDYAIIYTPDKQYVIKGSIKNTLELLRQEEFIRVHKSFIVAKKLITSFQRNKLEILNYKIPVGRVFKTELFDYLDSK